MADSLELTIIYEPGEDDWILARVAELPEVLTQGKTQEEARQMVLSALRDWLQFYVDDQHGSKPAELPKGARSESLALTFA